MVKYMFSAFLHYQEIRISRALLLIIWRTILSSALVPVYCSDNNFLPIPTNIRLSKKKSDHDFCVRRHSTVFILCVGLGSQKRRSERERFELMYGWIKLSYPTPPHQGPFYSPSIAEIGFSSALCHSIPHRPLFEPINSRSRLNNKTLPWFLPSP